MILASTHNAIVTGLREQIAFLEAELARSQADNRDLVNSIATQSRAPQPYRVPIREGKKALVSGRKGVFQKQRELEAANRGKGADA